MTRFFVWSNCLMLLCTTVWGSVSVKDHGAVGDGQADDSQAFEAALAASEGDLFIPPGRYRIAAVKVPAETTIQGVAHRSQIIMPTGAAAAMHLADRCTLRDLKFTTDQEDAGGLYKGLLTIGRFSGVTLSDLVFQGVNRSCILTDHASDVSITDCRFDDIDCAIHLIFSNKIMVSRNFIRNARVHGIQFWGNWQYERMESTDLVFANNYVFNGGGGAIWGTGARRVVMADNIIDGAHDIGLDLEWCDDSTIVGNTVRNCTNAAIALFLSCRNVTIAGNSMVVTEGSTGRRDGIWLTPTDKSLYKDDHGHRIISITGNTVVAEGKTLRHGINIGSGWDIVCHDNVMANADILDLTGRLANPALMQELERTMTVLPLSQQWRFKTDPPDEGAAAEWFGADLDDSAWAIVRSDSDSGWERQGFEGYTGYGWYRCTLPPLPDKLRAFRYLHFGAVDEQAWVYLNGELIFEHTVDSTGMGINALWSQPFTIDVSDRLRVEGDNVLAVRVHNVGGMGGIWKPVHVVMSDAATDRPRQHDAIVLLSGKSEDEAPAEQ